MRPSLVVWVLLATALVACMNSTEATDVSAHEAELRVSQLEWSTFVDPQGVAEAGSAPLSRLIRSEAGYRRLFGHGSPGIDFKRDVVVFYSAGTKKTGGYSADIIAIEKSRQRLHVSTQLTIPGSDCVVTQSLTTPSVLARVHGAGFVLDARFDHSERVEPCRSGTRCGGIAGIVCPGSGSCDQDDPTDDCDPAHAADCFGLCSCNVRALCVRGYTFDPSPAVCACVPDDKNVFCGGFAGIECPGLGTCVDDPSDECDLGNGGADCGGFCACKAFAKCPADSVFDRSAQVCACVKAGPKCGQGTCSAGQVCCNDSCGICTPPDGVCTQQFCTP